MVCFCWCLLMVFELLLDEVSDGEEIVFEFK